MYVYFHSDFHCIGKSTYLFEDSQEMITKLARTLHCICRVITILPQAGREMLKVPKIDRIVITSQYSKYHLESLYRYQNQGLFQPQINQKHLTYNQQLNNILGLALYPP